MGSGSAYTEPTGTSRSCLDRPPRAGQSAAGPARTPGPRSAGWRMPRRLAVSRLTGMKPLPLILSFLPLIAFSVLARLLPHGDIGAAGLTAAVIAAIAMVAVRPVGPPKLLNATSLVLFTVLAVLGFTG